MKAIFEKIHPSKKESITLFKHEKPFFDSHWHFHPEYELTYIIKSTGTSYVGNHVQSFSDGELLLLGPNLPHCWKNHKDNTSTAKAIVIQWLPEALSDINEFSSIQTLLEKSKRGVKFNSQCVADSSKLIKEMLNQQSFEKYMSFLTLLNGLSKEENYTILSDSTVKNNLSFDVSNRLDTILSYVENNFQHKIKLKDVANLVYMTESSFSRFFSQHMRRPFFEFLNEFRINNATRLLLKTNNPIAEIGFMSGYETLPFFYKQFKKHKTYTPLTYRKMFQEIKS